MTTSECCDVTGSHLDNNIELLGDRRVHRFGLSDSAALRVDLEVVLVGGRCATEEAVLDRLVQ